jgi:hypothetical protein
MSNKRGAPERSRSDIGLIINVVSTSLNDRICLFRHPQLFIKYFADAN